MPKQNRSKSALGGKKSKSSPKVSKHVKAAIKAEVKKEVRRIHISKTSNGKFLVDHEFKSKPGEAPIEGEQHAIEPEGLSAHVGEYLGLGAPEPGGFGGPTAPEQGLPTVEEPPISALPKLPQPSGPLGV